MRGKRAGGWGWERWHHKRTSIIEVVREGKVRLLASVPCEKKKLTADLLRDRSSQ